MLRRLIDILGAVFALVIFGPLMVIAAVIIRLDSPGGPIFRQRRVGLGGKPFVLYKFRTMREGTDPFAPSPGSEADHRLTKIGRFLRERSIDELPQLWNVIEGTMSLVGPRPLYEKQAEKWTARQRRRLEVRPGLTGLAQVSGRGGLSHEEKLEIDVQYVVTRSLLLDLKILAITLIRLFQRSDDIYETSRDN